MYKKTVRIISIFLISILLFYILFFFTKLLFIFPWKPEDIIKRHNPEKTDAIIVLEGEIITRIKRAYYLFEQNYSDTIFMAYIKYDQNRKYITNLLKNTNGAIHFYEGNMTRSTYEEALEAKRFIEEYNIQKIILVTSAYHSNRAYWIFKKVLPGIEILSVPTSPEESWYSTGKVEKGNKLYQVFKQEQKKFFLYYLLYGWRMY